MPEFVFLEHRRDGVHWDFMLEREGVLKTWAIGSPLRAGLVQPARLLPDHRLVYLTFEGAISGGRGIVARVDRGDYEAQSWSADAVQVVLWGVRFRGRVELTRNANQSEDEAGPGLWSFRFDEGNLDCKTLREGSLGG